MNNEPQIETVGIPESCTDCGDPAEYECDGCGAPLCAFCYGQGNGFCSTCWGDVEDE